jgi:Tetracyclin repressor-like, C-terminal domain
VKPALTVPRGEPRVRALFERWLAWEQSPSLPGGCPFMAASFELDDRPGPVRDFVVQNLRDWMDTLAGAARIAVSEGHFRADLDCEQFAHDCQGIGLAFVHASRLMRDPKARARAATAFESLLDSCRAAGRRR